jgi:hypothetical protein
MDREQLRANLLRLSTERLDTDPDSSRYRELSSFIDETFDRINETSQR